MRTLWSGQQIQTTPTYRRSSNVSILQTIPSYLNTLQPLYPVRYNEKIWFSIDFIQPSKTKPCQRDSMHPFSSTAALWDALVNLFIFPPLMEKEMTVLYFVIALSKRRKKERKTRVRSEDDAFLDGRASTAANTPRLIRLGWSFLSTLLRARGFVSSRVVAWLRANASRFSGVDSPPGNEWSGRQEEGSKKSIFLPLLAGRIDGGGGDAQRGRISSLVRGARDVSFQPISRSCESRIFVFWIESRFSSQFF